MSSLLGDLKKGVRESLKKLGEQEGFDYLIFISRILTHMKQTSEQERLAIGHKSQELKAGMRSVAQVIEKYEGGLEPNEFNHLTLLETKGGGVYQPRSEDTEKKAPGTGFEWDCNSTRKRGGQAGSGQAGRETRASVTITAVRGVDVHIPCHENFPNTLIEMSLETGEKIHFSKQSELALRQTDPRWNCSHSLTVESLEAFLREQSPLEVVLKLFLRRYGRLATEGLFVMEELKTARVDLFELVDGLELRAVLANERQSTAKTVSVALGKLGGAVEVQVEVQALGRDCGREGAEEVESQPMQQLMDTLKEVRRRGEPEGVEGPGITQKGLERLQLTLKEVNQENRKIEENEDEDLTKDGRFESLRNWREDWKNTVERLKVKDPEELSISFENRRSISVADIGFYNPSSKQSLSNRFEPLAGDAAPGAARAWPAPRPEHPHTGLRRRVLHAGLHAEEATQSVDPLANDSEAK